MGSNDGFWMSLFVPKAIETLQRVPPLRFLASLGLRFYLGGDIALESDLMKRFVDAKDTEGVNLLCFFKRRPLISVLMPVYNTDPDILRKSIQSVIAQVYKRWELCLVDDASSRPHVRDILKTFDEAEPRIRVFLSEKNEGISATLDKGARRARGEFLGVLDHDDELSPVCLYEFVKMINKHPDADCIYCDEDKIDESEHFCDPWHKSDWNPDLSLSFNYVMHFVLYRATLFHRLGGFRSDYDGSQDYDLLLRATEKTERIYHIPRILYHWRMGKGSTASGPEAKPKVFIKGLAALNDALKRRGIEGVAEDAPDAWKGVYRVKRSLNEGNSLSIVIVSSGDGHGLHRLIESIFSHVLGSGREILVCMPESPAHAMSIEEMRIDRDGIRWVGFQGSGCPVVGFNEGARRASGDVLWFLDDKMELLSSDSYSALMEQIQRDEVGAVGGKVYYGNKGLLEHAGVIFGPFGLMGYAHRATPDDLGCAGLKHMICNYSAVMGPGMMTRRTLFMDLGGFDESFKWAYWDADYCLRLRERGFLITFTPYAKFRHHVPVKAIHEMVVEPEAGIFKKRWQQFIDHDSYFNINLSREREDFSL